MRQLILAVICFWGLASFAQNTTFTKRFGGTSNEQSRKIVQLSSGDYYILGSTESYGSGGEDIHLIKTNALGDIIWDYAFGTSGTDRGNSIRATSDGGAVIVGYTDGFLSGTEDAVVFKVNGSGTIQWAKNMQSDSNERLMDVVEARNGDIYVTGYKMYDSIGYNIIAAKYSSSGNLFWYKSYGASGDDKGFGIAEDGQGRVIIVGSTTNDSISVGGTDIQLIRIDDGGNVLWTKSLGTTGNEEALAVKATLSYRYMITGWYESGPSGENMFVISMDTTGTVSYAYGYGTLGDDRAYDLDVTTQGVITLVGTIEGQGGANNMALIQTGSNGVVQNSGVYGGVDNDGDQPLGLTRTPDGGYTLFGNGTSLHSGSDKDLYLIRTNNVVSGTCGSTLDFVDPTNVSFTSGEFDSSFAETNVFNTSFTRTSISTSDSSLCCELEARVAADSLEICTGDRVNLGAGSLSGYTYSWTTDNSTYTSSLANPNVSPSQSTLYKLKVTADNGNCTPDSAFVYVTVNTRLSVDFARDTFFCVGNDVTITAYPGLNSYVWQGDGYTLGTNPVTIDEQDTLYLTLIDNNSCVYRDTVEVLEKALPQFSLGNDTTICENKDLTLEGPEDMVEYIWNSTASNSRFYTTNSAQVHTLTVTDSFGCVYTDQMSLFTNPFSTFSLGADAAFCEGTFFELTGPGALDGYIWNDTASDLQTIRVYEAGTYHLTAFNSYDCPYSDTIEISEWMLPQFDLGAEEGFCEGGNVDLVGPSNLEDYDWSNGDSTQTSNVEAEGTYVLTVTDVNGCMYTDSVDVVVFDNPEITTMEDTLFWCFEDDGNTPLNAGPGFNAYLWSTNATTQQIVVSAYGQYSVRVTDDNGCFGYDTTEVVNDCIDNVEYINGTKIDVYPIPATSELVVESDKLLHNSSIEMTDMYGKVVYVADVAQIKHVIDVSSLAAGQYFIRLTQDNNTAIFKVIVNR
ncbi:T9SS type A sorting domain-containing protein [bacterium]|nr:T9SS type A sorting domain-containing protein [bacterium]